MKIFQFVYGADNASQLSHLHGNVFRVLNFGFIYIYSICVIVYLQKPFLILYSFSHSTFHCYIFLLHIFRIKSHHE